MRRAGALRPLARDRDRRAGAHDHDPPDPPGRGLPAQAHDARSRSSCPPTAPRRATTGGTPPGTGPYRVAAWDSEARRDARPQPVLPIRPGSLARRRLRRPHRGRACTTSATIEPQIAAVQRGAADVAVLADPFGTLGLARTASGRCVAALAGPGAQQPGADHGLDVLQRAAAPVRRHPRAPGGQLRDRPCPRRRARGRPGGRRSPPARSCRSASRATRRTARTPPRPADDAVGGPRPTWSGRAGSWRRPGEPASASSSTCRTTGRRSARYYARLLDDLGFRTTLRVLRSSTTYDVYDPADAGADGLRRLGRRLRRAVDASSRPRSSAPRERRVQPLAALRSRARPPDRSRGRDAAGRRPRGVGARPTTASPTSRRPCR